MAIGATVGAINAPQVLYSASLSTRFDGLPGWFRVVGSYVLSDQVIAAVDQLQKNVERYRLIVIWLGVGSTLWLIWQTTIVVGIWAGDILSTEWSLSFVGPLFWRTDGSQHPEPRRFLRCRG